MKNISPIPSNKTLSSEPLLNIQNANHVFDDSLRKFNEISSARHLTINNLIRIHFTEDLNAQTNSDPLQPCNNIF